MTDFEEDVADFRKWSDSVVGSTGQRMTESDLAEAWRLTNKYGPANCWTGTVGGLAKLCRELLREIVQRSLIDDGNEFP